MKPKQTPSLRRTLLISLLLPTSSFGLALGLAGLLLIDRTIETAYDRVLDGAVKAIAERVAVEDDEISVDLPQVALGMLETRANDSVYYSVSYDRALVTGYKDLPIPDLPTTAIGAIRHLDMQYKGAPVRTAAIMQPAYGKPLPVLIEVAETTNGRAAARRELLSVLAALGSGIIVLGAVLVWFAVQRGLSPLVELGHDIDERQLATGAGLQPLDLAKIPREAHPPVRAMNELFARLEAAIQVVRNFIADASHQMKTPLTSLRVHLALLQRNAGQLQGTAEIIAEIEKSTRHLDRLATQLIAMARAEQASVADEDPQDNSLTDMAAGASEAVSAMAPFAAAKNVDLAFENEAESALVRVASSTLHDVLTNLIDNAIRYNKEGGSVIVRVFSDDRWHGVAISDDGPGIAPEHRERVFDRFYRVPAVNRPAGSGLGLAIVRTLLQQNGGVVSLDDGIDGRGITVRILLPQRRE